MRVCEMCGADISSRAASAKYCFSCAVEAQRERVKNCKAKNKEKIREYQKEYQKEYYARNKEKINQKCRERYAEKTGKTPAQRENAKQERLEEEESCELLLQAFGERFGRTHKHVNTMSQLEKDVAEATRLGISYGEYAARKRKEAGK